MKQIAIRPAEERDLASLDVALSTLSREIGDPHNSGTDTLARALFGTPPSTWARVADGSDGFAGAVLFSPVFSTVRGGPGLYVSDIWVDAAARGAGLGVMLLREAAETAASLWGAGFMRLSVHDDNMRARGFYRKLGFTPIVGESVMILTGQAFRQVRRAT